MRARGAEVPVAVPVAGAEAETETVAPVEGGEETERGMRGRETGCDASCYALPQASRRTLPLTLTRWRRWSCRVNVSRLRRLRRRGLGLRQFGGSDRPEPSQERERERERGSGFTVFILCVAMSSFVTFYSAFLVLTFGAALRCD